MKVNKKVFWISIATMLVSVTGIVLFTCLKDCNVWFEVMLNIFISLVGGAFLSAAVAVVNFYSIKFEYNKQFSAGYIECVNSIRSLTNWFRNIENKVEYKDSFPQIDANDFCGKIKAKMENIKKNQPYVIDLHDRVVAISKFDFNSLWNITDDYVDSIWRCKVKQEKSVLLQMIKMVELLADYDYLQYPEISQNITMYEQGTIDEYILYKGIASHFRTIVSDSKMEQLNQLQHDFLIMTKLNKRMNKIYNKKQK